MSILPPPWLAAPPLAAALLLLLVERIWPPSQRGPSLGVQVLVQLLPLLLALWLAPRGGESWFVTRLQMSRGVPGVAVARRPEVQHEVRMRVKAFAGGDRRVAWLANETVRMAYLRFGDWGVDVFESPMVTSELDATTMLALEPIVFYLCLLAGLGAATLRASYNSMLFLFVAIGALGIMEMAVYEGAQDLNFPEYKLLSVFFHGMMTPHEKVVVLRYAFMGAICPVLLYIWKSQDERFARINYALNMAKAYQDMAIGEMFGKPASTGPAPPTAGNPSSPTTNDSGGGDPRLRRRRGAKS